MRRAGEQRERDGSSRAADRRDPRGLIILGVILLCTLSTSGQIAVPGPLTHEYVVEAGETVSGTLRVDNTSDKAVAVSVEQRDYLFFADGSNIYGEPGSHARSNSPWTRFALPSRLIIEPGDSAIVRYWIDVPDDPGLVGTYWSIILVAPLEDDVAASEESPGIGLRAVFQYGVQLVTHIGGTGSALITLDDAQLLAEPEGTVLQLDISNAGERWLRPTVWTELYDSEGALAGRFESQRKRIFPGTSVRHRLLLEVPSGSYRALVVFDNGDENVWGSQFDFDL